MLSVINNIMKYYHGSINKIKIGEDLISKRDEGYTSYPEVEKLESLFERYKPKDKISRNIAVYLTNDIDDIDNLGGYDDYIYEVEPQGIIERSDLSWYSKVGGMIEDDQFDENRITPEMLIMIKSYWSGVPSDNHLFEYRCKSAKIVNVIESLEDDEIKIMPKKKSNIKKLI